MCCVWEKVDDMPRIPDEWLKNIYLYPTKEDAASDTTTGGSGFLVCIRSIETGNQYIYAVTNRHVIDRGKSPVIRLNKLNGESDVLELSESNWIFHPYGDDVAVCLLESPDTENISWISREQILTKEMLEITNVGLGDNVCMAGRFKHLPGETVLRFGNIATAETVMIRDETRNLSQESFVVEMRSLPGFSGSPVIVYGYIRLEHRPKVPSDHPLRHNSTWLLGIDWCHIHHEEPVRNGEGDEKGHPMKDKSYVQSNSGMAGVVPAWKLVELLDSEDFVMDRKKRDKSAQRKQTSITLDVEQSEEPKPFTKEDGD